MFIFHDAGDLALLAYSFTPTLLISAFHHTPMSIADRPDVLEIVYHFMLMYEKMKTCARNILPERKSAGKIDVRLFCNALLQANTAFFDHLSRN
jgi:hypothetical protein